VHTPTSRRVVKSVDPDEIDWEQIDTDELEREAIASTPGSQRTETPRSAPSTRQEQSFSEKLREAVDDGTGKRKREDDVGTTPKRAAVDEVGDFAESADIRTRSRYHRLPIQP
jgi:hypothetical protein